MVKGSWGRGYLCPAAGGSGVAVRAIVERDSSPSAPEPELMPRTCALRSDHPAKEPGAGGEVGL